MDASDRKMAAYDERIKRLELQWRQIDRLPNVFAVSPNDFDAVVYNKELAQFEVGATTGTYPPGTLFKLNRIFYFPSNDDPPTQ